jgi:hypothetical protein
MKFQEVCYVFALVACALLATAETQCGGAVDASPLEVGDASEDVRPANDDDAGADARPDVCLPAMQACGDL